MFAVDRAAVIGQPREGVAVQLEIGVALVVAKQNVELRRQRLDQVVLEQQGLGLGAHHRGLQPGDPADHVADAGAAVVFLKVAGDALFQAARLAHIQHPALRVEITVNARQRWQRSDLDEQALAQLPIGGQRIGGQHTGGRRGGGQWVGRRRH